MFNILINIKRLVIEEISFPAAPCAPSVRVYARGGAGRARAASDGLGAEVWAGMASNPWSRSP